MYNKRFCLLLVAIVLLYFPQVNILIAQVLQSDNEDWSVEVKYIEPGTVDLFSSTSEDSKVIGHFYYLDKILILNDKNEYVKFGWKKVVYPKDGFLLEKNLLTTEQKIALDKRFKNKPDEFQSTQNWKPHIIECEKEYSFIKKENDFSAGNAGIIKEGDEVLIISSDGVQNKEWLEIIYPKSGYVFSKELAVTPSNHILGIGIAYGFVNIPYEKNLDNYRNPMGGFIEYTKSNWDFLFRIGYTNSKSNLKEYILQNDIFYLHVQYTLFRLFNRHIRFYVLAGGGYWQSKFQFTKYPTLTESFPEESASGIGFAVGGGIEYTLGGFFLGVQYSFFGTEEAKFGPNPVDGELTTQYELFIGSNQVEVDFGYRFEF